MSWNEWESLLRAALRDLLEAAGEIRKVRDEYPGLPSLRVPYVRISRSLQWPGKDPSNGRKVRLLWVQPLPGVPCHCGTCKVFDPISVEWDISHIMAIIERDTRRQPREVLRALRRIQVATAWCRARAAGLRRAAAEILRQQAKAVEALEAETAMRALAGR